MSLFPPRTITATSKSFPISAVGTPLVLFDKMTGVERINELYEYDLIVRVRDAYGNPIHGVKGLEGYIDAANLDIESPASNWNLQTIIGKSVSVGLEMDGKRDLLGMEVNGLSLPPAIGSGIRRFNGLVFKAANLGVQGRYQKYRLTLKPWLALLQQSSDWRCYQQQSAPQIIDTILKKYPYPVQTRLSKSYPTLDLQIQYGSTDFDYFSLLCQEWGINYYFTHGQDGSHTLVLTDTLSGFDPLDSLAAADIWVYPPNLKLAEEYVSEFQLTQSHTSGQYTGMDFQFKQPNITQTTHAQNPYDTAHRILEVTEWNQGHFLDDSEQGEGQTKAKLYMEGIRQHGIRASGFGHIRGIQTAHSFILHNHSTEDCNREWIVRSTHYELSDVGQESGASAQFEVKCHFEVSPSNEPIRPDRITKKPQAKPQTATVVGPEGKELWVDQYARVKIQFHWDRYGKNNENSSCWVRVSSPWQGTNFGGIHHPRIGQEVIINFLNADGDMPYINGRLTNPNHMALWELPSQHALSGFKSKEIDGSQNNHLIMDDTPKQVQVQLTSDHGLSQLNLGYVTRIPDTKGRKDYRGQGLELRTDQWGSIRAAQGLAITTYARNLASKHTKDISEAIGILKSAHSQHKSFAELAIDHKADERTLEETAQTKIQTQNEEIAGHEGKGDEFPEFQKPHLTLSSPAGIELATPKSVHIATTQHTAITTGQDLSMSVGKRMIGSVAKGISMFTQTLGIKAFAAKGKVEIQAQTDEMDIIAEKVFKMISATAGIEFAAAKKILLTAGGSYIRIDGAGIEHGTLGSWKSWAGSHGKPGPRSIPAVLPSMPQRKANLQFVLTEPTSGFRLPHQAYEIVFTDGQSIQGVSNEKGETEPIENRDYDVAAIHILNKKGG